MIFHRLPSSRALCVNNKYISMALWGNNPKYVQGAICNARLLKSVYPGWRLRVCTSRDVPLPAINELSGICGVELDMYNDPPGDFYMLKRFEIADDPMVDIVLFRDSDSRFNQREADAVSAWLISGKKYHFMRDHPCHTMPIMGGMWGMRKDASKIEIKALVKSFLKSKFEIDSDFRCKYGVDQEFLEKCIYPQARSNCLIHDDFYYGKPWPSRRRGLQFVGQVFDENDFTNLEHLDQLYLELTKRSQFFGTVGFAKKLKLSIKSMFKSSRY